MRKKLISGKNRRPFLSSPILRPFIVLIALGFTFNINTIFNHYAMDDLLVIIKNTYVQQGIAGIPNILGRDSFDSYYRVDRLRTELDGGRYRPLSIVTFAIEQELFGSHKNGVYPKDCWDCNKNGIADSREDRNHDGAVATDDCILHGAMFRHGVQILFYIISVLILYVLARTYLFPQNSHTAFLVSLLFLIHPIHTEVVANVKSRDEILSLLFFVATLFFSLRYAQNRKKADWLYAGACYFLALLSKEYAVTLLVLVPAAIFLFMKSDTWKRVRLLYITLAIVTALYMTIRLSVLHDGPDGPTTNILMDPYLYASPVQKLATKVYVLLKYLTLVVFPHPLSYDYSYNTIAYRTFGSPDVIISIIIHICLIVLTVWLFFVKRHPVAFGLLVYFANLLLVSNFFVNIGATMGERLIYHSSLGFSIVAAWLLVNAAARFGPYKNGALITTMTILVVAAGYKTITRNAAWKNDVVLFATDINTVPNSALASNNAANSYLRQAERARNKAQSTEFYTKALGYAQKAVTLNPTYPNATLNLGYAYFKLGEVELAEQQWMKVLTFNPTHSNFPACKNMLTQAYTSTAQQLCTDERNRSSCLKALRKLAELSPDEAEIWNNIAKTSYGLDQYAQARAAWQRCIELDPENQEAIQGLTRLFTPCPVTTKHLSPEFSSPVNAGRQRLEEFKSSKSEPQRSEYLQQVIDICKRAMVKYPGSLDAHILMGMAYLYHNELELAEQAIATARKLCPEHPDVIMCTAMLGQKYFQQAITHAQTSSQIMKRILLLKKSAELSPNVSKTWFNLGATAFACKDFETARTALERCIQLNPSHTSAWHGLLSIRELTGSKSLPVVQ